MPPQLLCALTAGARRQTGRIRARRQASNASYDTRRPLPPPPCPLPLPPACLDALAAGSTNLYHRVKAPRRELGHEGGRRQRGARRVRGCRRRARRVLVGRSRACIGPPLARLGGAPARHHVLRHGLRGAVQARHLRARRPVDERAQLTAAPAALAAKVYRLVLAAAGAAVLADVHGPRPVQGRLWSRLGELFLDHVGGPPGHPRYCEYRRVQVHRYL